MATKKTIQTKSAPKKTSKREAAAVLPHPEAVPVLGKIEAGLTALAARATGRTRSAFRRAVTLIGRDVATLAPMLPEPRRLDGTAVLLRALSIIAAVNGASLPDPEIRALCLGILAELKPLFLYVAALPPGKRSFGNAA
jgi:hypothetical protein